jgi:hypothetical protein
VSKLGLSLNHGNRAAALVADLVAAVRGSCRRGETSSACLALSLLAALACGPSTEFITTCEPEAGITPICGVQNPEDLVVLPGREWLLFPEFRRLGRTYPEPDGVGALRISDSSTVQIYPTGEVTSQTAPTPGWGSPDCPGPPEPNEFNPLGMDVIPIDAATAKLFVVNQGGPESIELFEIDASGDVPQATWRGCVRLPDGVQGNNLAALPDGGFVVSTYPEGWGLASPSMWLSAIKNLLGIEAGALLEWSAATGWREIAGANPNGVLVSPDGKIVFYAAPFDDEVVRMNRVGKPERQAVSVTQPDNLTWTEDGKILAASVRGSVFRMFLDCSDLLSGTCGQEFAVVEISPESLATRELIVHQGSPMGMVTVALEVGDRIYLGTAMGDRIAYIDRSVREE